jgi:acetyl-CoA carboxylase beta subunit
MNWISNYVRPKINSLFSRREVPENLWTKCHECGTMLFHRELSDNLYVCTNCDHHMAISPRARFAALFDGGIFTEVKVPEPLVDPLQFRDQKKYVDRLKAARDKTGEQDAILVAHGRIDVERLPDAYGVVSYVFNRNIPLEQCADAIYTRYDLFYLSLGGAVVFVQPFHVSCHDGG